MNHPLRMLLAVAGLTLLTFCTPAAEDPKVAAKSFFEAFVAQDYNKAAKFATKDSKTLLDLLKSMEELGNPMDLFPVAASKENLEKIVYGDPVIDGDAATVAMTFESETQTIKLLKEEGAWKVALDKDMLKERLSEKEVGTLNEINGSLEDAAREIESLSSDSLSEKIKQAAKEIKDGGDTLRNTLQKAGEVLKKTGEALPEATKKDQ